MHIALFLAQFAIGKEVTQFLKELSLFISAYAIFDVDYCYYYYS